MSKKLQNCNNKIKKGLKSVTNRDTLKQKIARSWNNEQKNVKLASGCVDDI